eukprot:10700596-Alexandrium_andersonii.AAC.1
MSASLVGSEMCIRDSATAVAPSAIPARDVVLKELHTPPHDQPHVNKRNRSQATPTAAPGTHAASTSAPSEPPAVAA